MTQKAATLARCPLQSVMVLCSTTRLEALSKPQVLNSGPLNSGQALPMVVCYVTLLVHACC